jgi:macrolide-specific efflux system membrane fusion protein
MSNNTKKPFIYLSILFAAALLAGCAQKKEAEEINEVRPAFVPIHSVITTTGTVLPQNRLEIKPTINGRVEKILVKEGEDVKTGQIIGWMSSTERAALLDAARAKGEESMKYWEAAYKAIPLIAPIDGEVIVATTEPGQTVTSADAVIVLSDRLIVRAQVDETDIGKIKNGQTAEIALDAYPDTKIKATVNHIYYESKTVNNVTIYEVDLAPESVPEFFRSGMNANIDFTIEDKSGVLTVPLDAVVKEKGGDFVYVKQGDSKEPVKQEVKLGISDEKDVEVVSGITADDTVVIRSRKYEVPTAQGGSNPFMPARRR